METIARAQRRSRRREPLSAYLFLSPALLIYLVFVIPRREPARVCPGADRIGVLGADGGARVDGHGGRRAARISPGRRAFGGHSRRGRGDPRRAGDVGQPKPAASGGLCEALCAKPPLRAHRHDRPGQPAEPELRLLQPHLPRTGGRDVYEVSGHAADARGLPAAARRGKGRRHRGKAQL